MRVVRWVLRSVEEQGLREEMVGVECLGDQADVAA